MGDRCLQCSCEGEKDTRGHKSWMVSLYKGNGDAIKCGLYRGINLLEPVMKILEAKGA